MAIIFKCIFILKISEKWRSEILFAGLVAKSYYRIILYTTLFVRTTRKIGKFFIDKDMKAYKFKTTVSDKGIIQLPDDSGLRERKVEVIIISEREEKRSTMKASDFVNKWAGFISDRDTDQSKLDYLSEKYR